MPITTITPAPNVTELVAELRRLRRVSKQTGVTGGELGRAIARIEAALDAR